ncbi:MAG: trimeric intracellular cation channel family protein [Candidatus Kapaibacterium sp.]
MIRLLGLFGIIVFAISGTLVAGRKRMDLFGIIVVAIVTSIGGGTIRDLILGIHPVFWIEEPVYILLTAATALVTFFAARSIRFPSRPLLLFDAFGLALFTILGCQRALAQGVSPVIVVSMGVLTGVAGGVMRDLLCGEIPLILRREVYATASLAGGIVFVTLPLAGLSQEWASMAGIAVALGIRLAAIRWRVDLPVYRGKEDIAGNDGGESPGRDGGRG